CGTAVVVRAMAASVSPPPRTAVDSAGAEEERTLPPRAHAEEPIAPRDASDSLADSAGQTAAEVAREGGARQSLPAERANPELIDFLSPPQADDELGRLGGFRILAILGHGGMGVVYAGEDPKLGRKVAIKAMLPHLAGSKSSQQRFLREAKAAA